MDIFRGHYSAYHNQFPENRFSWVQHEPCYFFLPPLGHWNVDLLAADPSEAAAAVPQVSLWVLPILTTEGGGDNPDTAQGRFCPYCCH